jgi:hypothetical protein
MDTLAAIIMNFEGFELPALVVVDDHPPPIGLSLFLSIGNGILAN